MRSSDFLLLFFIIYDILITWLFCYIWWKTRDCSLKKDVYINDLQLELAKTRGMCYSKLEEDNNGGKRTN